MPVRKRGWLGIAAAVLTSAGLVAGASRLLADGEASQASADATSQVPGRVSEAELGNLIRSMGVEAKLDQRRYDFSFPARYAKDEWNLSMSAVLSENGNAIWVMAWLDPCPRTAVDVPRTALLKLLARNDTMGNGKFFAYIPANNRFVLERVVPNENITTAKFREVLQDLGAGVVETYPYWSVSNWKQPSRSKGGDSMPQNGSRSAPAQPAPAQQTSDSQGAGAGAAPGAGQVGNAGYPSQNQ
jgi:hypothetical protein